MMMERIISHREDDFVVWSLARPEPHKIVYVRNTHVNMSLKIVKAGLRRVLYHIVFVGCCRCRIDFNKSTSTVRRS